MDKIFVVTVGAYPVAAGTTLEVAQGDAFAARTKYQPPGQFEYRWDEHGPDVWRLMQRPKARGGRYSWTQYAVHEVPAVGGNA